MGLLGYSYGLNGIFFCLFHVKQSYKRCFVLRVSSFRKISVSNIVEWIRVYNRSRDTIQ